MTKYQLEVDYDYDLILIGISCHAKDYRLCWGLNQALDLRLEKQERDIEIIHRHKGKSSVHSVYLYYDVDNHIDYTLVLNRGDVGYLVPEQRQADFFLMISNNYDDEINDLISKVRTVDKVLTAYEVDIKELKSRENLLL